MGSSTRNTFPRFKKRLEEVTDQNENFSIIEILKNFYFKKKGISALQKNIISTLNSKEYKSAVIGIIRVSNVINGGSLSGLYLPVNFIDLKNYEKVDYIADFIGLQSEVLTNALCKTIDEKSIESTFDFVKAFTGNILKSLISTFCIEDIIEVIGEDSKDRAETEISDFIDESLDDIPLNIDLDNIEEEVNMIEELDRMFRNIYLKLKSE